MHWQKRNSQRRGRRVEIGLREERTAPAARLVETETGGDPGAETLEAVGAREDGCGARESCPRAPWAHSAE